MVVTIKRSKGGVWVGIFDQIEGAPVASFAGSPARVKASQCWKDVEKAFAVELQFDIVDEVWDDLSHLLPTDEEAEKMGVRK
ncbi:hypothetical protein N9937_00840 [bacterium]|nr:hypothetical protein [bacterium]